MKTKVVEEHLRLCKALKDIKRTLSWFFNNNGAISNADMAALIVEAQKRVDSVQDILWKDIQFEKEETKKLK